MLGLDAEDVVVHVDLQFVRPEVVSVQTDLERFLVVLHFDDLEMVGLIISYIIGFFKYIVSIWIQFTLILVSLAKNLEFRCFSFVWRV